MRKRILRFIVLAACRNPVWILGAALALTALSLLGAGRLRMTSEIADLLPTDSPVVRAFAEAGERLGAMDSFIVVLENRSGGPVDEFYDFADAMAERLQTLPSVRGVDYKLDEALRAFYRDSFYDVAPLFLDEKGLEKFEEKISTGAIRAQMAVNRELARTSAAPGTRRLILDDPLGLRDLFAEQAAAAKGNLRLSLEDGYYLSQDHSMLLMLVRPVAPAQDTEFCKQLMVQVRGIEENLRREFGAEADDVQAGYTGTYAIAVDYVEAITQDAVYTFITSFISVMLLFWLAFKRPAMLLIVGLPLLIGILWTLGATYFYFGHLNVVTSAMGAILMGLGIDYGIHIYNQYAAERRAGKAVEEALVSATDAIGSGLLSAVFTSVLAFFALVPTDFRGLSELGMATGVGLILCLVSMLAIMPALLALRSRFFKEGAERYAMRAFGLEKLHYRVAAHTNGMFVTVLLLTGAMAVAALGVDFDDDFKNIRPESGAAIALQKRLTEKVGTAFISTLVLVRGIDEEELFRKAAHVDEQLAALQKQEYLTSYQSIFRFFPSPQRQQQALAWLEQARSARPENWSYQRARRDFEAAALENGFSNLKLFEPALKGLRRAMYVREPLSLSALKTMGLDALIRRFYHDAEGGRDHEMVFYAFTEERKGGPSGSEALLHGIGTIANVQVLSPKILGAELKRIIRKDFALATVLTLLAVIGVLVFHFRRLGWVVMLLTPLLVGVVWMVGGMRLLGVPFNLVNVAMLPIIIGIGIDNAIYIAHHYLTDAAGNVGSTMTLVGRAVMMTSLTTMAGFGSLVFSQYGGLHTVGWAALLGIASMLVSSLIVLPLLLERYGKKLLNSNNPPSAWREI